ncbi:MAG: M20/M25/M40 family metallo-hydrolase [Pelolinea sp.]|nr:M20/M25/M40 family metallo-hydrolase [Pelolinea sp.]
MSPLPVESMDRYLQENLPASIEELKRLVAQKSISAQNLGLKECAELVANMLEKRGFHVKVNPTAGAPIVTAERKGRSDKTLLFYDHYDVQPPEPLELWLSEPFQPEERDGMLFGRGVSDNKGNIVNRLFAIDSMLDALGELPCAVKFLIEGEEEVSSANLEEFVFSHQTELKADACIWESGGVDQNDVPTQYLGLRGICYVELEVETASMDVHSGLGGTIFPNAAWKLVWALHSLKNEKEEILIDGFYDDVLPPSQEDLEFFKAMPDAAQDYRTRFGVKEFLQGMQGGFELNLAEAYKPSCTICGLTSGYQGKGSKTVLPARASAKIDFRLIPDQKPHRILELLRRHLDAHGFQDVKITDLGGEAPSKTSASHPFVQLVVDTAKEVYGVPMQIVPLSGGSGPNFIVQEALHVPIASLGAGYPGTGAHSPNENIRIADYLKSAQHIVRVLDAFGKD